MTPGIVTGVTEPAFSPSNERLDRSREMSLLARLEADIAQVDTAMTLVESGDLDAAAAMVAHLAPALDESSGEPVEPIGATADPSPSFDPDPT